MENNSYLGLACPSTLAMDIIHNGALYKLSFELKKMSYGNHVDLLHRHFALKEHEQCLKRF